MKPSTAVTALLSVSIVAVFIVYQVVSASLPKVHHLSNVGSGKVKASHVSANAIVPVTGAENRTMAPDPVYDAGGRIISLQVGGSNRKNSFLNPEANEKIAPVYDAVGRLVSDPTDTISSSEIKVAPIFDATGAVVSDPSGVILNVSH